MVSINVKDNDAIDDATAEIAALISDANPALHVDYVYRQAERLRDAIMRGTMELAREASQGVHLQDQYGYQPQPGR